MDRYAIGKGLRDMLIAASGAAAFGNYLNYAGASIPLAFAAQFQYVPAAKLEALAQLTVPLVTVAPIGGEKRKLYSRASTRKDFVLTIGVQKKLQPTTDPKSPADCFEVDGLMSAVDLIAGYLEPGGASAGMITTLNPSPVWVETDISSYDVDHMTQDRVFTSYIVVTYAYT